MSDAISNSKEKEKERPAKRELPRAVVIVLSIFAIIFFLAIVYGMYKYYTGKKQENRETFINLTRAPNFNIENIGTQKSQRASSPPQFVRRR